MPPANLPLISRGLPAFDSGGFGGGNAVANAIDADYGTFWRVVNVPSVGSPQWIALDISTVPDAQKTTALLHWYNTKSLNYWGTDAQTSGNYNLLPRDYTIEKNTGAGGGGAPGSGWANLATVTANTYRERWHSLNLAGANWVRLVFTAANGPTGNNDIQIGLDIHNATGGADDAILFLGDSITSEGLSYINIDGSAWTNGPLAQQVATAKPGRTPLYVNGGVPTTLIAFCDANKATLLNGFPGKYVAVSFGANDASAPTPATAYYTSLLSVIDYLTAQGKTVIVPKITKRPLDATADGFVQQYNTKIDQLAVDRPAVIAGPNMYAKVADGTIALRDGLHPTFSGTGNGYEHWQAAWRDSLLGTVYRPPVDGNDINDWRRAWSGATAGQALEDALKAKYGGAGTLNERYRAFIGAAATEPTEDAEARFYAKANGQSIDDAKLAWLKSH